VQLPVLATIVLEGLTGRRETAACSHLFESERLESLASLHCSSDVSDTSLWSEALVSLPSLHCSSDVSDTSLWSEALESLPSLHCSSDVSDTSLWSEALESLASDPHPSLFARFYDNHPVIQSVVC
jgi:hypothetical protein